MDLLVFSAQVVAGLEYMAVVGLGEDDTILKDANRFTHLDGAAFQHFDFVNNGFFGKCH